MRIAAPGNPCDRRDAARRRLPRFLFDYIDGGSYAEDTARDNIAALRSVKLQQRVLRDATGATTDLTLLGQRLALPIILGPVGLTGMYARRGEVQAARAARRSGIPYALSTVGVCAMEEVAAGAPDANLWFQLYVLRDRAFMADALARADALGITTLVFTVDMPVPGARYRDARSGMSGRFAAQRRALQAIAHPRWSWNVGLRGRPHDLGNISRFRGHRTGLQDYIGWLSANFDPSITWRDLEWLRGAWPHQIVIKGVLSVEDARGAQSFGADAIVVSNHGGRQLDGVPATADALPAVADAVGGAMPILVDSGIRSGLDVVRMLALGADAVLLGRSYIYALAADGEDGVVALIEAMRREITVAMTLTGARSVAEIDGTILATANSMKGPR